VKYILTILFLLTAYFVNAQYIPNSAAYQYKGLKQTNSLQPPTGAAFPVTLTHAPDSNYAAWYYNTLDTSFYQFNPIPKTWTKLHTNGGVQIGIDSIFITSIDSIFITNTDSIFIISGNDTIFIGSGNPAVDTIYQRGPDSIFAVKSGVEFLAAVTGSSAPSGGMDTAYQRNDTIFGVKNNAEFIIAIGAEAPTGVPGTRDTLWYNVKWFGAIGDGVTDDRAAIQMANDYVAYVKGGYIWFPAGVYIVSAPVYRYSYVNWEGVKDSSIIKNTNPTQTSFGSQSVMWMGNYNPSAYDTTIARFYRGHMGVYGNKMAIVDSIGRFAVGDVVVIEGMTGWTSNDGHWKPYVVRFNEVDSVYDDTVVFHYQIDTLLTDARINISGHFINPASGIDGNGHVKYLVRNVTTRNMVFESEGQWILGMSSLGCSWENIRIRAAELFTGNGMAWTTARNIYGQWWRQVSEFAIGCHNTIITGVNAHYINRFDEDAKPYIKFGENVHAITIKDLFIDAGNFDGNGVWFGASTQCVVDGIHATSQRLRQTHIEFSDTDLGDAPASYVNNNILRHGYFENTQNLNNYILMEKSVSAGQLRNNVVSDVTFIGPVNDATALVMDGYRPEFRDLYTTEGEISGGDSLYKGIISGGSIANNYDIHGNDSNVFIRSVFDTAGKNRSHFTDVIFKYIPDNITVDGQIHYNQPLDQLNFRHNGVTTDLLNPSTPITLQPHSPGYGIIGSDYDGTTPQTWALDTSVLNTQIFLDSSNIQYFVDTIAGDPSSFLTGAKVLVSHTGTSGVFIGHEDDVATLTGAVWSFQDAIAGDNLVVSSEYQPTSFYKFDGTIWRLQKRSLSIGGDRIGGNIDIGTLDNQNFRFFTNGFLRERISSGGQHYFRRYVGASSNNYLKIVDTATGRMDTASFTPLVLTTDGSSGSSTLRNDTLNIPVYSSGGGGGTVSSFSAGTLSPLFTTSVATATTTPALTFALSNAAANTVFGNATAGSAAPSFGQIVNGQITNSTIVASTKLSATGTPSASTVLYGNDTWGTLPAATTPAGNFGNIQINRNSLFATPASDSLSFNSGILNVIGGTTITQNALAATYGSGLVLKSTTAATASVMQNSPGILYSGNGWGTSGGATQQVGLREYIIPIIGGSATFTKNWDFERNGVFVSTPMTLTSAGILTTSIFFATTNVTTPIVQSNGANTTLTLGNAAASGSGSTSNRLVSMASGTVTQTNGDYVGVSINPTYNIASGTVPVTAFRIQPVETALGSGTIYAFETGSRANSGLTSSFTPDFQIDKDGNASATGTVNAGTLTSDASAILQASSTTKGFLLPRMTKTQRNAISSPTAGLCIYQTDNTPGLRVYNGTNWMKFTETTD
jgi:hypothetical protein